MPILSLVLVTLAARLLADLTTLRLVPVFRIYLFVLIVGMLIRGDYTPAWMGLAILVIKFAATVGMMRMLYARESAKEIRDLWVYSISAGLLFAVLVFLFGFEPQAAVASPMLVYARQLGQALLAAMALSMTVFSWAFHRNKGFIVAHSWLMTILWIDYAVIGLTAPRTGTEWRTLDAIWTSVAIFALLAWIATISEALPARAARRCWWWIVRVCGLRWWLTRFRLLVFLWHRSKSPSR